VQLDDDTLADLQRRLRRIEGQIRGIQQMLDDQRSCRDVVTQVSAAGRALNQVGLKLLVTGMAHCLADPEVAAENGFDLDEVETLFLKLA
jgi:DNA-binding FrmR family transcriptional regulator